MFPFTIQARLHWSEDSAPSEVLLPGVQLPRPVARLERVAAGPQLLAVPFPRRVEATGGYDWRVRGEL